MKIDFERFAEDSIQKNTLRLSFWGTAVVWFLLLIFFAFAPGVQKTEEFKTIQITLDVPQEKTEVRKLILQVRKRLHQKKRRLLLQRAMPRSQHLRPRKSLPYNSLQKRRRNRHLLRRRQLHLKRRRRHQLKQNLPRLRRKLPIKRALTNFLRNSPGLQKVLSGMIQFSVMIRRLFLLPARQIQRL